MHCLRRTIASCFLVLVAVPDLRANDVPVIRLSIDHSTHKLQVQSWMRGTVFLVLGPVSVPPIRIGDIELDVSPLHTLTLGHFESGAVMGFEVPRALRGLSAEAVAFDPKNELLYESNVVSLGDFGSDLIDATFRARLVSTGSRPPYHALDASLTAPTSGYQFMVDGIERDDLTTHVYLRLVAPAAGEVVKPVLTEHAQFAALGPAVSKVVNVYLLRTQRGTIGVDVYRLMAQLPGAGEIR